jgi:hypothetical protein
MSKTASKTKKASKKASSKKASKKASKPTSKKAKKADKKAKADKPVRSGLTDVPNAETGKAIRRMLRKEGIRLSDRPDLGKVPVKVKDGTAYVKIDGQTFKTAIREPKES